MLHESALIEDGAQIGQEVSIWHLSHIRSGANIGDSVVIGRGVYVGPLVQVGARSKIQNNSLVYDPASIGEGVFIGPGVILTNDQYPRAVNADSSLKRPDDWSPVGVTIRDGASIGAGSICVAPLEIGEWAMIGAGSVVIRDVPAFALVVGNPARQIGWVSKSGHRLALVGDSTFVCPNSRQEYVLDETSGTLSES